MGKEKDIDRIQDLYLVNGDELRYDPEEFHHRDNFEMEILERHISDEVIIEYASETLDMITEDDLDYYKEECDLSYYYDEEQIICSPLTHDSLFAPNADMLDVADDWRLKEIMQRFVNSGWDERDKIYNAVFK